MWEATDDILGRPVAVKILLPHLAADDSFRERFRREAIAAARLAHPHVVATFDTGVDDGLAFIVLELVHGRTLHEVITQSGAVPAARAVSVGVQVADALDYAHRQGVVHRDVKPGNILLTNDDQVKVADFGIAKAAFGSSDSRPFAGADLTQSGAILGTAKYLSPEQVNGEDIDGRADIYSLGVVLYEMLCGRPPYMGETDVAVAMQHVQSAPPSLRKVRAGIPRTLEAVVMRAMAKRPADRYATAADLQSALLSVDLGPDDAVPMVVRDPTPPEGVPQMTFRESERSWLYPVAAILAVAVALGIIGLLFARTDTGQRLLGSQPETTQPQATVTVARTLSFDPPPGSQAEHDEELPFLVDGDPSSTWSTETYSSGRFGGLKDGVGVILVLSGSAELDELVVSSSSRGWSARVFVADSPKSTLAEWGDSLASKNNINSTETTFDLEGRTGTAVLLWITDLGRGNQVALGEVEVTVRG